MATWKVKVTFTDMETQDLTVWASQVDGSVVQVEIDGSTMTGTMSALVGPYQRSSLPRE